MDALLGVIIGGILTGIGTWITLWLQHKKWKIEQKIRILENKKKRYEDLAEKTLTALNIGMKENKYDSNMLTDIEIIYPENVFKALDEFMHLKDKSEKDYRFGYISVAKEIKLAIKEVDNEISSLLN